MRREARKHHDKISPQTWGCTELRIEAIVDENNLPTDVGMYLPQAFINTINAESPHRRGDVPANIPRRKRDIEISPQTWGCTVMRVRRKMDRSNLPTDVGMYRKGIKIQRLIPESPHRRGDVPPHVTIVTGTTAISPQTWGCTALGVMARMC